MKRLLFFGLFLTMIICSQSVYGQAENIIYGKQVTIKTRDTSSAELKVVNSTRNVPGYLKNVGGGQTRFTLPDYTELINKPTTFPPSSHTHGNAEITDLAWSKLTGVPDFVLVTRMIDSLALLQARINTKQSITDAAGIYITISRTIDSLAALQTRIQTKEPLIAAGSTGQYWRGDKTWQTLDKTAVGLSNVPNTDATNATNISSGTLADGRLSGNVTLQGNSFNAANQLVKLDGSGKLPTSTIPSLAITEPFVVASQAAMLALTAQTGDVAVRTDEQKTYILASEPASTLSNWVWLRSPSSESDPVYTASSWYSTTNNAGNWNTAFSWGNHASAGYAMASRTITINGTTYDLTANRSWTVGDVVTSGSYSNPAWITTLSWAKLTGVPSTFTPSSHTHPYSDLTGTVPTWNQNTTGNAATWGTGNQPYTNLSVSSIVYFMTTNGAAWGYSTPTQVQNALGLGSNAYTSTSYLPTTGGTLSGITTVSNSYITFLTAAASRGIIGTYNYVAGGGSTDYSFGLFSEGDMFFSTNGSATKRMTLTTSGASIAGSVTASGIYATSNSRNYLIEGALRITNSGSNAIDVVIDDTEGAIQTNYYGGGSTKPLVLRAYGQGNQLYLNTNGNIGINSTVTPYKLTLNGSALFGGTGGYEGMIYKKASSVVSGYNQTFEIQPETAPGSGTATALTYFKNVVSGGTTRHDIRVDGNIYTGSALIYFGSTSNYISFDTELGWNMSGYGYLKTAAFQDANQDLLTTSNVTFNQVTATILGSVGTLMDAGGIISGTPRVIRLNIGGTYYYVTGYPNYSPPIP